MSQSRIEFVYFDLGNILVTFDPEIACRNVAQRFSVDQNQTIKAAYDSGLQDRYEHGEISGEEYATAVRKTLNIDSNQMSTDGFLDAISDMFAPIESMAAIVTRTIDSGCRVGVLSNTCFAHWYWIQRQAWPATQGPFEVSILSCEVGSMKPDALIYEAAEKAAGVAVDRILFLDDKPENVQAAVDRGWNAKQCVGGDSAKAALNEFGIACDPQCN